MIGKGSFASVFKVTNKIDGKCYAAKVFDKRSLDPQNAVYF